MQYDYLCVSDDYLQKTIVDTGGHNSTSDFIPNRNIRWQRKDNTNYTVSILLLLSWPCDTKKISRCENFHNALLSSETTYQMQMIVLCKPEYQWPLRYAERERDLDTRPGVPSIRSHFPPTVPFASTFFYPFSTVFGQREFPSWCRWKENHRFLFLIVWLKSELRKTSRRPDSDDTRWTKFGLVVTW